MKKLTRWICVLVFLTLCGGVLSFLCLFTQVGNTGTPYLDWGTCVIRSADGTERSFDPMGGQPDLGERELIRLSLFLPEERPGGFWLIFEITGAELWTERSSIPPPPVPSLRR